MRPSRLTACLLSFLLMLGGFPRESLIFAANTARPMAALRRLAGALRIPRFPVAPGLRSFSMSAGTSLPQRLGLPASLETRNEKTEAWPEFSDAAVPELPEIRDEGEGAQPTSPSPHSNIDFDGIATRSNRKDSFGGPVHLDVGPAGQILYGVRSGLNIIALDQGIQWTLSHLPAAQIQVPATVSELAGRSELLTRLGPQAIHDGLTTHAASFFAHLPYHILWETLVYQTAWFFGAFAATILLGRAAKGLSQALAGIPSPLGAGWIARAALGGGLGRIPGHAYTIAAAVSTAAFVAGHAFTWGVAPHYLILNAAAGLILARVAYRTRPSPLGVIAAYGTFVFMTLFGAFLTLHHHALMSRAYDMLALTALPAAVLIVSGINFLKERLRTFLLAVLAFLFAFQTVEVDRARAEALLARGVAFAQAAAIGLPWGRAPTPEPTAATPTPADDWSEVWKRVHASVVKITAGQGIGTGFVVSNDGLVMTNAHVVKNVGENKDVRVTFFGSAAAVRATVVKINVNGQDIAFLQLPEEYHGKPGRLEFATVASTPGEPTMAIGNPLGFYHLASHGIVSGVGVQTPSGNKDDEDGDGVQKKRDTSLITDTPINKGSSGGPLFNRKGQVIGMNTQIFSTRRGEGFLGIGIDIPAAGQPGQDLRSAVDEFRLSRYHPISIVLGRKPTSGSPEPRQPALSPK